MPPSTKTLFGSWTNLHFGESQLNKPADTPRIGQVACFITVLSCGLWPLGRWSKDLRTTSDIVVHLPIIAHYLPSSCFQHLEVSQSNLRVVGPKQPKSSVRWNNKIEMTVMQKKRDELDDAFPVSSAEIHSTNYLCTCSQHSGLALELI